jgi:hypothetical protein
MPCSGSPGFRKRRRYARIRRGRGFPFQEGACVFAQQTFHLLNVELPQVFKLAPRGLSGAAAGVLEGPRQTVRSLRHGGDHDNRPARRSRSRHCNLRGNPFSSQSLYIQTGCSTTGGKDRRRYQGDRRFEKPVALGWQPSLEAFVRLRRHVRPAAAIAALLRLPPHHFECRSTNKMNRQDEAARLYNLLAMPL